MDLPPIVAPEQWQAARDVLLEKEKAATRALDELAAERRRLPLVRFDGDYRFAGPDGEARLVDLFDGRRQLIVYQFMDRGPDEYCFGCAAVIDNVGNLAHLHARDTTFVAVSDMPLPQIASFWQRMGWTVPFYSSRGSTFRADCGVGGGFGYSVFLRDGDDVYRSYFTTGRGADRLRFDFSLLDLTPLGRQEEWEDSPAGYPQTPPYTWWRLHDEYDGAR